MEGGGCENLLCLFSTALKPVPTAAAEHLQWGGNIDSSVLFAVAVASAVLAGVVGPLAVLSDFVDKKENTPKWLGIWIKSLFGMNEIIIADPTIASDILKDNKIVDKNSGLGKMMFHPRL